MAREKARAVEICTDSPEATGELAKKLGSRLRAGMVLCLVGDLGAGKTLFAQGIAAGLGVLDEVTSPTFNLMNLYAGRLPMAHFDLYRLEDEAELDEIGFYEYTDEPRGVALIEWADKFPAALPEAYLRVELRPGDTKEARHITFSPVGGGYDELMASLEALGKGRPDD